MSLELDQYAAIIFSKVKNICDFVSAFVIPVTTKLDRMVHQHAQHQQLVNTVLLQVILK